MSDFGVNQGLVEEMFLRWAANPSSVDDPWRRFFDGLPQNEWPQLTSAGSIAAPAVESVPNGRVELRPNGPAATSLGGARGFSLLPSAESEQSFDRRRSQRPSVPPPGDTMATNELQAKLSGLVNAYRIRGHRFAELDPLGLQKPTGNDLSLERYGLAHLPLETMFATGDLAGPPHATLAEILERLQSTYSRHIGVEYSQLESREARDWLQQRMESTGNRIELAQDKQLRILTKLVDAEIFEQFLHTKFIGAKRFSLEGGESCIPLLDLLTERASEEGVEEIVIGMAHRGRLNVMVNIMGMDVRQIFAGFVDLHPENYLGRGDVKYHLGYSIDRPTATGRNVHMTLCFNPSHLEWVNPVVEGRVRAKQDRKEDDTRARVLPLLIHGDAAFVGQGIVAETLNLSMLPAYRTGGTIHVVINNQIGFTTNPEDSRSTWYCTDITRMLRCPVFHVNGEDPEAVVQTVRLAVEYRQKFGGDIVIDLYCYRKYGHNEGDEPRFTQPVMYGTIDRKRGVREVYVDRLVETGKITREQAHAIEEERKQYLEKMLTEAKSGDYELTPISMTGVWTGYEGGPDAEVPDVETGVPRERLLELIDQITTVPSGFVPHPRVKRFVLEKQREVIDKNEPCDWGTAENLALASLLADGHRCRLTGQDVRRGTFSHRHAEIFDSVDGRPFNRLAVPAARDGLFEIADSPLSEAGVLGFEWGYSLDTPEALVIWEAQFGDFVNTAQVIIDQFISSSEDKWHRLSGLVMLLPHGFEGAGPEHSSARLERFLGLAAEDNIQVVNPTTPAQVFHMLRRQILRPWRKPLVVLTPKSLLRHRRAVSSLDDLAIGEFQRIIPDDPAIDPAQVKRVVLCSGKVYYDLLEQREESNRTDIALVRLEQLYPLRLDEVRRVFGPYSADADYVWAQEEPWNMGAWFYVHARMPSLMPHKTDFRCIARPESASPATGSNAAHKIEQKILIDEVFAPT